MQPQTADSMDGTHEVLTPNCAAPRRSRAWGGGLSGEKWYNQQAARAVNQAIGRVIRCTQVPRRSETDQIETIFLMPKQPVANHRSQITSHKSQITIHKSQVTSHKSQIDYQPLAIKNLAAKILKPLKTEPGTRTTLGRSSWPTNASVPGGLATSSPSGSLLGSQPLKPLAPWPSPRRNSLRRTR